MEKHVVHIDQTKFPGKISFPTIFNAAVPMVDRHLNEGRTEKTVIRCVNGTTVTYKQLQQRVNQSGHFLLANGFKSGDRILIVVKDSQEFFYLFWGAIKVGVIPVPVNTILRSKDYRFFIDDIQCRGLFYSRVYSNEVLPAVELAHHKPDYIFCVDSGGESLLSELNQFSDQLEARPTSPDDDCFILYSSGSTGNPKGAVHSHRTLIVTCIRFGEQTLKLKADDVIYSAAKLFFAYGLSGANNFVLWAGASVILDPQRPTPESVINVLQKYQPSIFFGVPTLYAGMLKFASKQPFDASSLRLCSSAGEALPAELFRQWKRMTGSNLADGIGSTENLSHFLFNPIGKEKEGTSGLEVPGYQAKIIDHERSEVPVGAIGQLIIKGESMAERYWNNPEKSARTMVDGWLYTGDSYSKDEQGYFHCQGRNDDMLKVGGIWCSPLEIEGKLFEHMKVLEAAVVGAADENGLIKPKAFIVTKEKVGNIQKFKDELRDLCKNGLAPYKYPRWFEIVNELPKTATGKIQRFRLREGGSAHLNPAEK
jgi:benzoate-CoA ligase family protein